MVPAMPLFDEIGAAVHVALKAKDAPRVAALRSIRAAFLVEQKKDNAKTLTDEVCISLLRKLEKQRHESIEAFEKAGRPERVAEERAELAVIEEFLPRLADEATTRAWVEAAIASSVAGSIACGKVAPSKRRVAGRGRSEGSSSTGNGAASWASQ